MKLHYLLLCLFPLLFAACPAPRSTSDAIQQETQETLLKEGVAKVGMPAIHNFRRKQILKQILERCDQNFVTYAYIFVPMTGKFVFLGECVGYGIPAATQFTAQQKAEDFAPRADGYHVVVLPQADPDGTFAPSSADATWVMMLDPVTKQAEPQEIEDKVDTFTFKLPASMVMQ